MNKSPIYPGPTIGAPLRGDPFRGDLLPAESPAPGASELFAAFRARWWKIALWTCACIAVGVIYLVITPPDFQASALILLEPRHSNTPGVEPGSAGQFALDAAQADSQIQVVRSERLLHFVFDTLDLAQTPEFSDKSALQPSFLSQLLHPPAPGEPSSGANIALLNFMSKVNVRRIGQSYVLEISYTAPTAAIAANRANSVAAAYIWNQLQGIAESERRNPEILARRIADINAEVSSVLEAVRLGVIKSAWFPDSDAKIISAAVEPPRKSAPQSSVILGLAAVIGLISSLGLIAARHRADRTLRYHDQVAREIGVECIAIVPRAPRRERARLLNSPRLFEGDGDPVLAALRCARTAIMTAAPRSRPVAVGVTSIHGGEGKSVVAARLARVIAASGDRTLLIDANFYNPTLSEALAPGEEQGLTEFLRREGGDKSLARISVVDHLSVVRAFAGGRKRDPNVFLGSARARELFERLRSDQVVVVDLPATSVSSDARALSSALDGIILVVAVGRTTIEEVREMVGLLSETTSILGIVLNNHS
jgi:polysaccharide biosynthesis transport protein